MTSVSENEKGLQVKLQVDAAEQAIEPSLAIIDPHRYFCHRKRHTYLRKQCFADASTGHNVVSTVYVECLNDYRTAGSDRFLSIEEPEFVANEARISEGSDINLCDAIICNADLTIGPSINNLLDNLATVTHGRLRGVRYVTAYDPDPRIQSSYRTRPGMLSDKDLVAATRLLGKMGLTLDLSIYFHQLGDVIDLARECPKTSIVIDHCGGPINIGPYEGKRDEVFLHWKRSIDCLGEMENVYLKFGGLPMRDSCFGEHRCELSPRSKELAEAWSHYFDTSLAAFGTHRMMFESNFPVGRAGAEYTVLWNAFKHLSWSLSDYMRRDLLSGTAARVYRLRKLS